MIVGRVDGLQATIAVVFRLANSPDVAIEFVVDTGFEGAMTLPASAVAALGLPFLTDIHANLANDVSVPTSVHRAIVSWNNMDVPVAVLAMGRRPLLGTALLSGKDLSVRFMDGGPVTIEDIL